MTSLVHRGLERLRDIDTRLSRQSSRRRILVDGHTPMNFVMVAPVVRAMERDGRIEFYFTSSTNPERIDEIYRAAGPVRTIHPWRAALMKFDAYVASDFIWAPLLRGTERVQVFHGVAGKYGFDAPTESMRQWDRLFFVNERRLRNFVAAGAIDAGSIDAMVDFYFEKGADGLTILGIMGEAPKLTQSEAIEVTRRVLARASGRPVIVGVSAPGFAAID